MGLEFIPNSFQPPKRASKEQVEKAGSQFLGSALLEQVLAATNSFILVLNKSRQVVYANKMVKDFLGISDKEIIGLRPGEVLNCEHAFEKNEGCGTSDFCSNCGAMKAILASQKFEMGLQECRINTNDNNAYDFKVLTSPLVISENFYTIFSFSDISHEKRRRNLERIFFHDILNAAGGLRSYLELMEDADEEEKMEYMINSTQLVNNLIEEINAQKELASAENDELSLLPVEFSSLELIKEVSLTFNNHDIGVGKKIEVSEDSVDEVLFNDKTLVRRVLINLIKNALEATKSGEKIKIGCWKNDSCFEFVVENKSFIPEEVQKQIFQRSYSTKGSGRGLGTYSVRLLTEKYLNGHVKFNSDEINGTQFSVCFPLQDNNLVENTHELLVGNMN